MRKITQYFMCTYSTERFSFKHWNKFGGNVLLTMMNFSKCLRQRSWWQVIWLWYLWFDSVWIPPYVYFSLKSWYCQENHEKIFTQAQCEVQEAKGLVCYYKTIKNINTKGQRSDDTFEKAEKIRVRCMCVYCGWDLGRVKVYLIKMRINIITNFSWYIFLLC